MRQILEPLKEYATELPGDVPPEILPLDSDHSWGLDGAARSALGLLVAGEAPGERLYAVADYLLAFCTSADRSGGFPDALLLNGTALALCGYLCEGKHPEAEIWRVTGCARLVCLLMRSSLYQRAIGSLSVKCCK